MTANTLDHVPISTGCGVTWSFMIPSDATVCSEQAAEAAELGASLFDTFGDVFTPIRLRYGIALYEDDVQIPPRESSVERLDDVIRDLRNEAGITKLEFVDSTTVDRPGIRWIPKIPFEYNRLKMRLDDGDQYVERQDCVSYSKGEPTDWEVPLDPLQLRVWHTRASEYHGVASEFVFRVTVGIHSDVWLEPTDRGDANRAHLSSFLERLAEVLPYENIVHEIDESSDFWVDLGAYKHDAFEPEHVF